MCPVRVNSQAIFSQFPGKAAWVSGGCIPMISHTVPFLSDSYDGHAITQRRTDAKDNMPEHRSCTDSTHLRVGHDVSAGEVSEMIVARMSGPTVNGRAIADISGTLEVTSVQEGPTRDPLTLS